MGLFAPVLAILVISGAAAEEPVVFAPMPSGATKEIGSYAPQRVTLSSERPATLTKVPDGLASAQYAVLPLKAREGAVYHVALVEVEGQPPRLFVDANGNGDLTDDAPADWAGQARKGQDGKESMRYSGGASLQLGTVEKPFAARISMYRFDKSDPTRAPLKDVLLYYRDYATAGEIKLGGKSYRSLLSDENATGDFRGQPSTGADAASKGSGVQLFIDVNANGKFDGRGESYDVLKPFNLGGTVWQLSEISRDGTSFKIAKSDKQVAEILPPPDHAVGKIITAFEGKNLNGQTLKFPGGYKGKIVLLDFWATWCGPCMSEMPNVAAAYEKFHSRGFDILGVSLDNKDAVERIQRVASEQNMPWEQIYDGGGWKAAVAQLYAINSIPRAFLVDGDTGEILADSEDLRGGKLGPTIERALANKQKK